jgi:hypothetical protein
MQTTIIRHGGKMMLDRKALRRQFELLRLRTPALSTESDEDLFPVWILLTLATAHERQAAEAICGGSWDRGVDALLTDQATATVWIVQGKFRQQPDGGYETADDSRGFAQLAKLLAEGSDNSSEPEFWRDIAKNTRGAGAKFLDASDKIRNHGYKVHLVFASLWRFRKNVKTDASRIVARSSLKNATIDLLGGSDVQRLLAYYIRDIAPAVPDLELPMPIGDPRPADMGNPTLKAWTIAATGEDIAKLVDQAGEQVYARNIRRGLGDKVHVSKAIQSTIRTQPSMFWYLNNGLTISCDEAQPRGSGDVLWMRGAQIINGQQTSRSLHATLKDARYRRNLKEVMVGVRVIALGSSEPEEADEIVADIVEATNFQNAISKSDLRSNDLWQIELEREFAARGYRYLRKRGIQDSAAPLAFLKRKVKKEEIAVAVAGALYESLPLRLGQSPLFDPDQPYYHEIFKARSADSMLACYWLWRTVNRRARGSSERQAAKFLVHYEAFRALKGALTRRERAFIEASERNDRSIVAPLEHCCDALFSVALASYRANQSVDGHRVAIKPYHQRKDLDVYANLIEEWNGNLAGRPQISFERSMAALRMTLGIEG